MLDPHSRRLRHLFAVLAAVVVAAGLTLTPAHFVAAQTANVDPATQKLFDAIDANDYAAAQVSVEAGAKVDTPGRWGMTAIELAVDKGYFKIAHYLVAVRNFQGGGGDDKSKGVATRATPGRDDKDKPPAVLPAETIPVAPAAGPVTATAGKSGPKAPAPPAGTVTEQPFYAPLAGLETTAGREAERDGPSWPAGKPNPFDPGMPAVGSNLEIIGEIGRADPGIALRPVEDTGQPKNAGKSLRSSDSAAPTSSAETSGTAPEPSDKARRGSGLGSGVIGATRDFQ
jgi:hypothetical protein